MSDIWKDPMVKERLKEGWTPDEIAVLQCPDCGQWAYYNQGSTFSHCDQTWYVCSEDEEAPEERKYVRYEWTSLEDLSDIGEEGP